MDSGKLKKLQDYSVFLTQQAESNEKQGKTTEAVKDYVKLVDVLLLLASETKDHATWQQLIGKAEFYQRKARAISDPRVTNETSHSKGSGSYEILDLEKAGASQSQQVSAQESSSVMRSIRKIPSLIGRRADAGNGEKSVMDTSVVLSPSPKEVKPVDVTQTKLSILSKQNHSTNGSQTTTLQTVERDDTVSYSVYAQLLSENAKIQKEIENLQAKEREYLETIEARDKEFEAALSDMVPRSEYEELETKLADSAVSKERVVELQAYVTELEIKLRDSVPRVVIDDIADYVSFLVSTIDPSTHEKVMARLPTEEKDDTHNTIRDKEIKMS